MKCLILAAGYATRLYPLTENFPKPLLQVGHKTILDWLIDDIETAGVVEQYIVISNHKFAHHFDAWAANKPKVTVLDDGTDSNETRLGAVKDVQFAIEQLGLDTDLLVIAGDNLLDFSLTHFVRYALQKQESCVMRYFEKDENRLKKSGVLKVSNHDRVEEMWEKPQNPQSNWCCPPFYYYTRESARLVAKGIAAGCGTDAPGSYIAWLCRQTPVYAMEMPGSRYDIGSLETYEKAQTDYKGIQK